MKTTMLMFAAMMTLAAQGLPGTRVTAKVPFPFEARGQAMAAGTYELMPADNHATMRLREVATGRTVVLMQSRRTDNRYGKSWLAFQKYGDKHFLNAVASGLNYAVEVGKSKRERELAKVAAGVTVVTKAE